MKAVIILFGFLLLFPGVVFAHTEDRSENVSVTMHIEPSDEPSAQEPSEIHFHFSGREHGFELGDCICTVRVKKGTEVLQKQLLDLHNYHEEANATHIPFTFPELGVYTVKIDGKSKTDSFEPFEVEFSARVNKEFNSNPTVLRTLKDNWTYAVIVVILVIGSIVFFNKLKIRRR